jgi:Ca2+-binding EF-hand superfamily protein
MIEAMLNDRERKNNSDDDALGVQKRFLRQEDIEHWYEDYCLSCQREQERIERQRSSAAVP